MLTISFLAVALHFLYPVTLGQSTLAVLSEDGPKTSASNFEVESKIRIAATAACKLLDRQLDEVITLPTDAQYTALSDANWSQTAWKHPLCIAQPSCTSHLQQLLTTLAAMNVPFAIRSGGHSPNPFDANINTGVLISMDKFNTVTYDFAKGTASFGPGNRWKAIYDTLDPFNVTVVGGRVLDVGVGGLTLGSGLSYLSDLYGLVCDNVVSYDVVLGDGRAVEASSNKNPELFWALKGGANNFGIVTKITSKTYPISAVWGSVRIFGIDQMPAILSAVHEYQTAPKKDLYANMVLNLAPSNGSIVLTLVYLRPVENPVAYAPFYKLTPIIEQSGLMTLTQLQSLFPAPELPRWAWWTVSFKPNSNIYAKISSLLATAPEIATITALQAGTLVGTVQPINANVARAGQARGGNTLGLQAVDQTWFALNAGWWNSEDDATANAAIESLHRKIEALANGTSDKIQYIFMNDANAKQPVLASYGSANVQRLRAAQRLYDPLRVFQRLVKGGQKIPA